MPMRNYSFSVFVVDLPFFNEEKLINLFHMRPIQKKSIPVPTQGYLQLRF